MLRDLYLCAGKEMPERLLFDRVEGDRCKSAVVFSDDRSLFTDACAAKACLTFAEFAMSETDLTFRHFSHSLFMTHDFKAVQGHWFVLTDTAFLHSDADLLIDRIDAFEVGQKQTSFRCACDDDTVTPDIELIF